MPESAMLIFQTAAFRLSFRLFQVLAHGVFDLLAGFLRGPMLFHHEGNEVNP